MHSKTTTIHKHTYHITIVLINRFRGPSAWMVKRHGQFNVWWRHKRFFFENENGVAASTVFQIQKLWPARLMVFLAYNPKAGYIFVCLYQGQQDSTWRPRFCNNKSESWIVFSIMDEKVALRLEKVTFLRGKIRRAFPPFLDFFTRYEEYFLTCVFLKCDQ
jgi:hypothetical protein